MTTKLRLRGVRRERMHSCCLAALLCDGDAVIAVPDAADADAALRELWQCASGIGRIVSKQEGRALFLAAGDTYPMKVVRVVTSQAQKSILGCALEVVVDDVQHFEEKKG